MPPHGPMRAPAKPKNAKGTSDGFSAAERAGIDFGDHSATAISNLDAALASAGIVAIISETAQAFMECAEAAAVYETALAKISTIADPAQASMEAIKTDITALSQETGQSVNDLSESVYQAISASVETAGAVEVVRQSNMLAVGGFTDTTTAVAAFLRKSLLVTFAFNLEVKVSF